MNAKFKVVDTTTGRRWVHECGRMWIKHYPLPNGTPTEFYQAYEVAAYEEVPRGRWPWTVNNFRLNPNGFRTMEEAMSAIEKRVRETDATSRL